MARLQEWRRVGARDREPGGDAARLAARKGDRRPIAWPREQSHAVTEEIDGQFQIVGREMEPLRRTARARGFKRDDARDGALRQRQQRRIVGEKVGRGRERQAREVPILASGPSGKSGRAR